MVSLHYTLFEKSNFCPKIQFWHTPTFSQNFSLKLFWQFSSWNQSCQELKKSKTTTFSRVFHPKKIDNFLGKSKLNFWTKNEDFEFFLLFYFVLLFNSILKYLLWIQFVGQFCTLHLSCKKYHNYANQDFEKKRHFDF